MTWATFEQMISCAAHGDRAPIVRRSLLKHELRLVQSRRGPFLRRSCDRIFETTLSHRTESCRRAAASIRLIFALYARISLPAGTRYRPARGSTSLTPPRQLILFPLALGRCAGELPTTVWACAAQRVDPNPCRGPLVLETIHALVPLTAMSECFADLHLRLLAMARQEVSA